jgi:hypothetical protein
VGRGGALGALDRGWEAAEAAVDGEQELRRRFGEVESSGKEKQCKCGCGNARGRALGTQGCPSSREEGTASESWCWRPTGTVAAAGGARAEVEQRGACGIRQRGRARVAAVLEVMYRGYQNRRWRW